MNAGAFTKRSIGDDHLSLGRETRLHERQKAEHMNISRLCLAVVALTAVLCAAALILRALRPVVAARTGRHRDVGGRLTLGASLALDQRRKIVVVGYGAHEILLLLAPDGNLCCGRVDRMRAMDDASGAHDHAR